ncbi:MAG: DNA-directed RNA polymerase subunit omega [Thermoguttaceae bacterium]
MLEELKDENLINKVGGRFKLSALIQKRLVYLNKGARSFVDTDKKNKLQVVLQEIMDDKVYLDTEEVEAAGKDLVHNPGNPLDFDFSDSGM